MDLARGKSIEVLTEGEQRANVKIWSLYSVYLEE